MSSHISDELPRLLTGDASRDVVMAAAEHLRTCPDCQQDLVSAVVAHASLTSAHRFAPDVVAPAPLRRDRPGSASVSSLHGAAVPFAGEDSSDADPVGTTDSPALPNMSQMFDQIRQEAASAPAVTPARRRITGRSVLAVAATAVVLTAGAIALEVSTDSGSHRTSTTVALASFDTGHSTGKASIKGDEVDINAASLPTLDSQQRYEVWLTDSSRRSMLPIGFIGDDKTAKLTVPDSAISKYSDIEVSVQRYNQIKYSRTSVLRGSYS